MTELRLTDCPFTGEACPRLVKDEALFSPVIDYSSMGDVPAEIAAVRERDAVLFSMHAANHQHNADSVGCIGATDSGECPVDQLQKAEQHRRGLREILHLNDITNPVKH